MKKNRIFISVIIVCLTSLIYGQKKPLPTVNPYQKTDKIAMQLPDSLSKSTTDIATYLNAHLASPTEKVRGAFTWIASSIQYDVKNMLAVDFTGNREERIKKALKDRKGICMHYAEIFHSVCTQLGIKSYVIGGYTKQNGAVSNMPHAWCAGLLDNNWYFFDPTWAAGYVQNNKFVRKINNDYFKIKPEQMISSHIPFDPLWQFLNYPITNQEFYDGKTAINKQKPFFNYLDTLTTHEKLSELDKLIDSSRRIEQNGIKNYLISNQLQQMKQEIDYYTNKTTFDLFNNAVNFYNEGINLLNAFVNFRNKQFTPKKSDEGIKIMIDEIETALLNSQSKLKEIKGKNAQISTNIAQLSKSIEDAFKNLDEQKEFLNKYFNTPKLLRKSLFYKYTLMGIPIN